MPGAPPATDTPARCPGCGGVIEDTWRVCGWCGGALASQAELHRGTELNDRFRIESVLGRGGFGITYRARDQRLQRVVAIKELFPPAAVRHEQRVLVEPRDRQAFDAARVRFQREAAALARFNHPGIVRVFEVIEANNTAYLVMELVEGRSLHQLASNRAEPLDVTGVLDAAARVGRALDAVHEAGLLHRDVNPSNVMIDASGRVVLIDFGLARRYGDEISGSMTRAVTPGYAPPEQYAGSARVGPPCDVYGLAATTYRLLTGVTPTNVFERQAGAALPPPVTIRPDIPALVSQAVLDGMELNQDHRPASASAFLDRLGLHGLTLPPRALLAGASVGDGLDPTDVARPDDGQVADPAPRPGPNWPSAADPPAAAPPAAAPAGPVRAASPARPAPVGPPPEVLDLRGESRQRPFAPWHDGSPAVVGPADTWRGWVTFPVAAGIIGLASATPIFIGALIVLALLPGLATVGDLVVHRHRQRTGADHRSWHRARPATIAPALFARNLGTSAVRSVPAIAIAAIGFVAAQVLEQGTTAVIWRDLAVRSTGIAIALVLLVPARHGGRSFRCDLGITEVAGWAMERRTTPGMRTVVVWVISAAALAFGAWLHPEMWPLG